ncbi:UNVERIFIED_CONTAM: hypothetical protein FKN15_057552 [Acipenser sinensis]
MKCLREKGQGPRIDQYFLRSQSSQSNEIQRQEANHSSQDISTPVIDVRRTCMDTVSDEPNDPCEPGQTNQHKREKNLNGHKPGVKWPRACEKTAWNTVNTDLCFALERLSGTVEKKLDKFGDIIYAYGSERFGVEKRKEKVQTIPGKSRRQQEIERLVRERRQLRKQWRRAEQSQKEGLNLLQRVIKDKLATLRRAERLRKRYKKKERARANFYKDPFKFVKKLFTSEKNGTLKASKDIFGPAVDEMLQRSQCSCGNPRRSFPSNHLQCANQQPPGPAELAAPAARDSTTGTPLLPLATATAAEPAAPLTNCSVQTSTETTLEANKKEVATTGSNSCLSMETEEEKAKRLLYCSLCKVAVNSALQLEAHNSGTKHKTMLEARSGDGNIKAFPRPAIKGKVAPTTKAVTGLQNKTFHCEVCNVHVNSETQLKQVSIN